MATKLEHLKWKLHNKKFDLLVYYGIKMGLVYPYEDELLKKLRHVYYGGLPLSIMLLCDTLSNGNCYDAGVFITEGFGDDDYRVLDMQVDTLKLNPEYIDGFRSKKYSKLYHDHCVTERTKKDGTVWIYDTSLGLVFEKKLYQKLENPKLRVTRTKKETKDFLKKTLYKDSNIENDKYILPIILPNLEANLRPIQDFYLDRLKEEIQTFKEEINYEEICKENKKLIRS